MMCRILAYISALGNNTTNGSIGNVTAEPTFVDKIIEAGKAIATNFYGLFSSISALIQYMFAWGFSLAGIQVSDSVYILIGNIVSWYLASTLIMKYTKLSMKKAMIISAVVFGSVGVINVLGHLGWLPWKLGT